MEPSNIFLLLCGIIAILLLMLWAKKILRIIFKFVVGLGVILLLSLLVLAVIQVDVLGFLRQISTDIFLPPQETMVVHTDARVRSCPRKSCSVTGGLEVGDIIQSQGRVAGELVNGNSQWIEFENKGAKAYVWSGLVSLQPTRIPQSPPSKRPVATKPPTTTKQPTIVPTEVEILSPRMCSYVYRSPSSPGVLIGRVNSSHTIHVLDRVENRGENKDLTWVEFMFNGEVAYVNSSRLSTARPPYFPTKTPVAYRCNCDKICDNMTCAEAFYQLVKCGCRDRDKDQNGIPCNVRCKCS